MPNDKDLINLFEKTRWTSNIFNAYKDVKHFYLTNSNKKFN